MNSIISTPVRTPATRMGVMWYALRFVFLSPFYLTAAWLRDGRGIGVRLFCLQKGLTLLAKKPSKQHARWIYFPLDSTRYIEIDFVRRNAGQFQSWLDVSSPRQIAALLLTKNRRASTILLNPDPADLAETRQMAELLGLDCKTVNATVDGFHSESRFDLITITSVLEHIPADAETLKKIWQMLNVGGRLVLTVPACAGGGEQLIDRDPYGLKIAVEGGFFYQRFYSEQRLREFREIIGDPVEVEVWGEREKGWLQANFEQKRRNPLYPVWREPYDMAVNWRRFETIDNLPGEGVFCAVFQKKTA